MHEVCPSAARVERGLARGAVAAGLAVAGAGVVGLGVSPELATDWGFPIGSAGAFAAAGISLVAATLGRRLVARAGAAATLLVAALSVPQTMSPSAGVSFTLLTIGLFALSRRCPSRRCTGVAAAVALVAITHCALTLAVRALGVPVAFGWGIYARMASGTAWLMCLLGAGVLLSAFRFGRAGGVTTWRWSPPMAVGGMVGATLILWQVISEHDHRGTERAVRQQAESMGRELARRTTDRARLLDRLTGRWANDASPSHIGWEHSVREWVRDYPGMTGLSWADTTSTVRLGWQSESFAFDSVGARLAANPSTAGALQRAAEQGSSQATLPLRFGWFGPQVLIISPVKQGGRLVGYLTSGLDLDAYVESVLDTDVAQGYGYALRDGGTLLHERKGTRSASAARWHVTVPVSAMGRPWTLTVWPTDEIIAGSASIVPTAVLVSGLLLAALLGWIALVAQRSRELTNQLSELVGELATENAARRESEQMRAALVHSTIDGVAAFDASGCVSAWNPRMASLTGRAEAAVDGKMIGELIPFLETGTEVQMLLDALAGRGTQLPDVRATESASGAEVWLDISVTPMRSTEGHTVGGLLVARDITERKRVADLVLAGKVAAEEANRAKSDFLARMSHELRTPLNAVIGFTNVLRRNKHGRLAPDELTYIDRIGANGRHLLGLINEVLDLAKVESGRDTAQLATASLSALVADTIAELDVRASGASVRLQAQLPSGALEVSTDEAKLKQVLINLIGNAIKFTPAAGRVTVRVVTDATTGRPSRIDVEDTGIGIPPEHIGAIFEAFEQVDTDTSRRFGGTGLGLAISRKLCELMGYELVVRSQVGIGSTFSIMLSSASEDQAAA